MLAQHSFLQKYKDICFCLKIHIYNVKEIKAAKRTKIRQ